MFTLFLVFLGLFSAVFGKPEPTFYDLEVKNADGVTVAMDKYNDKVLLVVNVASQCGYTETNYRALQTMYDKYNEFGFEIAAFPCNQFGGQEPAQPDYIKDWASEQYSVTFDMYSKVEVKGSGTHPVFQYLTASGVNANVPIQWNFDGKFVVGKSGEILKRFTNKDSLRDVDAFISSQIGHKEL